jgi:hypothetical protein
MPPILISRCRHTARIRFNALAEWGTPKAYLMLSQNAAAAGCIESIPALPALATYKVAGVTYKLIGACGEAPLPSCSSRAATLILSWKIGPRFYTAFSQGFLRGMLLSFATSIKRV